MITFAAYEDIEDLKKIWKICFEDQEAYINLFFTYRFRPDQALVYRVKNRPVSMVFMLPARVQISGTPVPAHYIYAAATLPEYQGRGLMKDLLHQAEIISKHVGQAYSLLVPGEKSLFEYYGKLGYQTVFQLKTARISYTEIIGGSALPITEADSGLMVQATERYLSMHEFSVLWDLPAMEYVLRETAFYGGRVIGLDFADGPGYAVILPLENQVLVKEVMCDDTDVSAVLSTIARAFPAERYIVRLRANIQFEKGVSEVKEFGMMRPVGNSIMPGMLDQAYMNLVLD